MDLDGFSHVRDIVKMLGRVGVCVVPLLIVVYVGVETLSDVEAGTPETSVGAILAPTIEDRTRAILHSDLDEAWGHYESGDYSEDMWKGVYTHVTGKWNVQAKGKGWSEFAWAPAAREEPTQLSSMQSGIR